MENQNISGREIFGCKVGSLFSETTFGKIYTAEKIHEDSSSLTLIYHATAPTFEQQEHILKMFSGDQNAATQYISDNIEKLRSKIDVLKNISFQNNNSIAPVFDYDFVKDENSNGYNLFVHTCLMKPLGEYVSNRGITVADTLSLAMQMLNGTDYAHAHSLSHGFIGDECLFVDSEGKCKVFGFEIASALKSENFDVSDNNISIKDDIASVSFVIYKFFNNFKPPFHVDANNCIGKHLNGSTSINIAPPFGANREIASALMKGLAPYADSYNNCTELVTVFGKILNSTDGLYLNAKLVEAPDSVKIQSADSVPMNSYENNNSVSNSQTAHFQTSADNYPKHSTEAAFTQQVPQSDVLHDRDTYASYEPVFAPEPAKPMPKKRKEKSSKGLIILIIILSVLIVALLTLTLLWKFGVVSPDFIPGLENSKTVVVKPDDGAKNPDDDSKSKITVTFAKESVILDYNATEMLEFKVKGADVSTLTFKSSDETVVTVSPEGELTAKSEGEAEITVFDSEGNELNSINVTVSPKPDIEKIDIAHIQSMLRSDSQYGIYVYDVAEQKEYLFDNSHNIMGSSALVCLPILYAYSNDLESGALDEYSNIVFRHTYEDGRGIYKQSDDGQLLPAKNMVTTMLKYGDNNCINSLMNHFGINYINSIASNDAITGVNVVRNLESNPGDSRENQISAYACGQIFNKLMTEKEKPGSDFITTYFRISDSSRKKGLASKIPTDVDFLNHNAVTSTKYNEIMYVESGNQKFIVVFISSINNASNRDQNMILAGQIGQYIYESFMSHDTDGLDEVGLITEE